MRLTTIQVPAMDCPTEETIIRRSLLGMGGVIGIRCDLRMRRVVVENTEARDPGRILCEFNEFGLPGVVDSAIESDESFSTRGCRARQPPRARQRLRSSLFILGGPARGGRGDEGVAERSEPVGCRRLHQLPIAGIDE